MSVLCSVPQIPAGACTGITLKSKDGATVVARTIEWAESVMNCMYVVVPRAQELQSLTPSGMDGLKFRAKHGFVGLAVEQKEFVVEGMNEKDFPPDYTIFRTMVGILFMMRHRGTRVLRIFSWYHMCWQNAAR